jgi:mono/diheme cytochrome c family protein
MRFMMITAIGTALVLTSSGPGWADAAAGKTTFAGKGCNACHYTDGPAKEKTIDDQLAKKGPELWYAGSKFQKAWLGAWLAEPKPIRLLKYGSLSEKNPGDHPKLAGADAANMTDFLMGLTSDAVKAGMVKVKKKNIKGKQIFIKKMPCSGCHQSPGRKGKIAGGFSGPSLVGAGTRLNPDWVYAYLKTPSVFKPVKAMPTFAGILKDKDMKNVAAHVATMK